MLGYAEGFKVQWPPREAGRSHSRRPGKTDCTSRQAERRLKPYLTPISGTRHERWLASGRGVARCPLGVARCPLVPSPPATL